MKQKTAKKHLIRRPRVRPDLVLEAELAKARGRVRAVDVYTALLVLLVGTLAYGVSVIALDQWLHFPGWVRQIFLGVFVVAVGIYLFFRLIRPLGWQVNLYYAARALERSSPQTRNGLVNWLDLRNEHLPPAIRGAVQEQAAIELQESNLDEAIPVQRPMRLFFLTAGLIFILFLLSIALPDQIGSLLYRAFLPFDPKAIPTDTRLQLVKPEEDEIVEDPENASVKEITVEPGVPVLIAVVAHGTKPAGLTLEYQYSLAEKPLLMSLSPPTDEAGRLPWTVMLPSERISAGGLWFRVTGGDGQTRQYRLVVAAKSPPSISDVEVIYHYPPYTRRPDKVQNYAPLKALAGTKVDVSFTADQPLKSGTLEVRVGGKSHSTRPLELAAAAPRRLVLKDALELTPELKGQAVYRINMTSVEDRESSSLDYPIEVEEDQPPSVEILRIGQEELQPKQELVKLPLNDVTPIVGKAQDDIAVGKARLRLQTEDKRDFRFLGGKPEEGPLQKASGYALPAADYQLILDLTKLAEKSDDKKTEPAELKVGQMLELWVEATDNREPQPNVGQSRHIKIELIEPLNKEQRQDKQNQTEKQEKQRQEKKEKQNPDQQPNEQDQNQQQDKPNDGKEGEQKQKSDGGKAGPQKNQQEKQADKNQAKEGGQGEGKNDQSKPENGKQGQPDQKPSNKQQKGDPAKPDNSKEGTPEQKSGDPREKSDPKPGEKQKNAGEKQQGSPENKPDAKETKKGDAERNGKADSKPANGKEDPNAGEKEKADPDKSAEAKQKESDDVSKTADKLAKAIKEAQKDKQGADKEPKNGEKSAEAREKPGEKKDVTKEERPNDKASQKSDGKPEEAKKDPMADKQKGAEPKPGEKQDSPERKPGEQGGEKSEPKSEKGKGDKPETKDGKKPDGKPAGQDQKPGEKSEGDKKPGQNGEKPEKGRPEKSPEQGDKKPDQRPEDQGKEAAKQPPDGDKKNDPKSEGGNQPKQGGQRNQPPTDTNEEQKPDDPNEAFNKRATDLLLETFREKMEKGEIDRDVLKKMNWSEKELKNFMDQYQKLKNQGGLPSAENVVPGSGNKANLKSVGPTRAATTGGASVDANLNPALKPPPDLQNPFEGFNKQLSRQKKK